MKKFLSLVLALCLVLSIAAAALADATVYPASVTDHAGRTVTIEAEPQRIVSGYYISTSALMALGLTDRIVGIEAKADKRAIYKLSAPQLIELPNVGTAKEFNMEGCLALEPELVILPLKLKSAAETLEQMGIPVLLVNPESETELKEMLSMLATAANALDREAELTAFIAAQEAFLSTIQDEKPSVYLAGNSALLSTAGEAMYQSHMIDLAGGVNVAAELTDTYWAEISYEQLLAWNPDYIVLASDAGYTVEEVLADPNLADCKAIAEGHVLQIPGKAEAWDSPVPSGILGSVWLASMLHPEEVSAENAAETINAFYETFYGFTYDQK